MSYKEPDTLSPSSSLVRNVREQAKAEEDSHPFVVVTPQLSQTLFEASVVRRCSLCKNTGRNERDWVGAGSSGVASSAGA